jgi:chaperonin GroEL
MGAMFVSHMLWRMHEQVGDGTATAAVLFQAVYEQGLRYVAAGGNAAILRRHLESGLELIMSELSGMALQLEGKHRLAELAESICYDPPLAAVLGEIFDILGEHGRLEIRAGHGRTLEREYAEGMHWDSGILSRAMLDDPVKLITHVEQAAILITDLVIADLRELVPVIEMAVRAGARSLVVVASKLSEGALALLHVNRDPAKFQAIAVKTPEMSVDAQARAMEDLAILTGGRPVLRAAGDSLRGVKPDDLGHTRRAWANTSSFGIAGGQGDPRALRAHVAGLRAAFGQAQSVADREQLQQRIGKLLGGSATLHIGGATELEIESRQELARRTSTTMRGAMRDGVVPGGGVALLRCREALECRQHESNNVDEQAAYRLLSRALAVPLRTIVRNAGYDPGAVMAQIEQAGSGYGCDVRSGTIVDMRAAGIFDVLAVQQAAAHSAISSAALALTVDVLVHRKQHVAGAANP